MDQVYSRAHPPVPPPSPVPPGTVAQANVEGQAWIVDENGNRKPLKDGDFIKTGDVVETDTDGNLTLGFKDETNISISENAKLKIDEYVFDPDSDGESKSNFSLLRGLFEFTGGLIGGDGDNVNLDVPAGFLGIRGTRVIVDVAADGTTRVILIDGHVVFTDKTGRKTDLNTPFQELTATDRGAVVTPATEQSIQARYGDKFRDLKPRGAVAKALKRTGARKVRYTESKTATAWVDGGYSIGLNQEEAFKSRSESWNAAVGIERAFSPTFLGGIAFRWDESDTDTTFNLGNMDSKGLTVSPYIGHVFADYFVLDAAVGGAFLNYNMNRLNPNNGQIYVGDFVGKRLFGNAGTSMVLNFTKLSLSTRVGYLYVREWQRAFTETEPLVGIRDSSQIAHGSWSFGGNASYRFGRFTPFLGLTYVWDTVNENVVVGGGNLPNPKNDDTALHVRAGFGADLGNGMSAGLSARAETLRDNFQNYSFSANLSIPF